MNGRTFRISLAVVAAGALLTACGELGSGDIATDVRDVDAFDSIEVSGALNIELDVDSSLEPGVVVKYDDNLIDQIKTEVRGDTLHVGVEGSFSSLGAGRVVEISADRLVSLEISGATDMYATGEVGSLDLVVSGASDVSMRSLEAEHVSVDVSGASDVTIYASESVVGSASGASDLNIYGTPNSVGVDSSGASDVDLRG